MWCEKLEEVWNVEGYNLLYVNRCTVGLMHVSFIFVTIIFHVCVDVECVLFTLQTNSFIIDSYGSYVTILLFSILLLPCLKKRNIRISTCTYVKTSLDI